MKVKGFTLIELLAVIVILAIIALIAVPIVLNIIGDTRVSAAKRSAENYIDAVELYLVRSEMDTNKVTLERGNKYNLNQQTTIGEKIYPAINDLVEITGSKPTGADDYIELNEKGKVTDAKLTTGGYNVEVKDGKIVSATKGDTISLQSISLNITNQTMENGSVFKLIPTFTPSNATNQEVTYTSNDTNIVTVDATGTVTSVNPGSTKVTVISKEDTSIKAECNIIVVVSATGLTVTPTTAEIKTGEEVQLEGTIEPSNATTNSLTWKSSNADIASVDINGKVTGVSVGSVTITASTVNGIEATSIVTVKELISAPTYEPDTTGAAMDLPMGLTPIVYKDSEWKVADTSKSWYNYDNQEWANAVILNAGVTKNVGDTVDVSTEIKGMFVYVPRYEYKIEGQYGTHTDGTAGTQEQPGEIKVNFISKETTTATSGYILHPSFTFGTEQLSGIWVGKFETTGDATTPTVLPSVTSLRDQKLVKQFIIAQKFSTYINNSSIDFHMAKNSEWGAVAYLSQSKYGKYGNSSYVGIEKKVRMNTCTNYITGVGADSQLPIGSSSICTTNIYTTAKGQAASTTGNITGVYDMSGGAYDRVMGVYNKTESGGGFTSSTWPDAKYYDNYTSTIAATACDGGICYGHALSETSEWYRNNSYFFTSSSPWLTRGGSGSSGSGVFNFDNGSGYDFSDISFRVVLTGA